MTSQTKSARIARIEATGFSPNMAYTIDEAQRKLAKVRANNAYASVTYRYYRHLFLDALAFYRRMFRQ